MDRPYHKSTRTQYPEFLATPHDTEFGARRLNTGFSRGQAVQPLPESDAGSTRRTQPVNRYSARDLRSAGRIPRIERHFTGWPRTLRRRQTELRWEPTQDANDWRSSSACIRGAALAAQEFGAPRAVGAEINPPLFPRVVFARGEAGERGRGAERRAFIHQRGVNCP